MSETLDKRSFHNPYEGMTEVGRVTTDISRPDYMLIKLLRPTSGTISGTLGLLWKKLCYELRQRDITDHTQCDAFETFIANCRIISSDEYDSLTAESAQWRQSQAARGNLVGSPPRTRATPRRSPRHPASQNVGQPASGLGGSNPTEQKLSDHISESSGGTIGGTESRKDEQGSS